MRECERPRRSKAADSNCSFCASYKTASTRTFRSQCIDSQMNFIETDYVRYSVIADKILREFSGRLCKRRFSWLIGVRTRDRRKEGGRRRRRRRGDREGEARIAGERRRNVGGKEKKWLEGRCCWGQNPPLPSRVETL